jgi:hypothetical protein
MRQKNANFQEKVLHPTKGKINLVTFEKHIKQLCPHKNFLDKERIINISAHVEGVVSNL